MSGGDFVVEAVSEILSLKQDVFEKMDAIAPPDVILASETSGLGMTDISARTKHPERCIVTHNYTPPHLITRRGGGGGPPDEPGCDADHL